MPFNISRFTSFKKIKCQKILESCEKHIYIFRMTLWSSTLFKKLLSFSINLFACQLDPPRKLPSWAQFPSDFKHSSLAKATGLAKHACSALPQRNANPFVGIRGHGMPSRPTPHCHVTSTVAFVNLAMFRTPTANSLWILKWHKDQEKVHACSSVQESSSYVLQLGTTKQNKEKWKTVHLTAD